jgi:CRISPR system Cascade subunit CasB
MRGTFNRDTALGKVLVEWWNELKNDRGGRAILRRASSITLIVMSRPYQGLYRRLRNVGWRSKDNADRNDYLAAAVGLLAHVRNDDRRLFSEAAGGGRGDSKAEASERVPVSELRFVRLLESPDIDALFVGLRRVLPLIDHSVDVVEFANDIVHWDDTVKKRWAYGYKWPDKSQ